MTNTKEKKQITITELLDHAQSLKDLQSEPELTKRDAASHPTVKQIPLENFLTPAKVKNFKIAQSSIEPPAVGTSSVHTEIFEFPKKKDF